MTTTPEPLAPIPLIDLRGTGPIDLFEGERHRAEFIVNAGRRLFSGVGISLMDRMSERWARREAIPYLAEIETIAAAGLPRGVWFMNLCFEWGCTTGACPASDGNGVQLLRTLDWPFRGLGRMLVVTRQSGPAGEFYNVTWPGFVGVVTAMAPGRFSIAINQAPLRPCGPGGRSLTPVLDWLVGRVQVYRGRGLPPVLLLRQVMETCRSFQEARKMLSETSLALPVFFTLAGCEPGEACVIERLENQAYPHETPAAVANDWLTAGLSGRPRGIDNAQRLARMRATLQVPSEDFSWLSFPVLNSDTRVAMVANAAAGQLRARGYEAEGAATQDFDLTSVTNS